MIPRSTILRPADDFTRHEPPPDGLTTSRKAGAALGFRRLAIIDLVTGQQPLANEDETVWIAFNGEIYNYRELRPDLEARGHRFRTHSDTETIVHLYEEYGPNCVERLRGMFALAIWDERRQRLFLARDRLGKKPLFYRLDRDRLLFGSELKTLLQYPGAPREVDPAALDAYLTYQYVPHPECILQGYHKLPPAHWAIYEKGRLQVERYWIPPFDSTADSAANSSNGNGHSHTVPGSYEEWKKELRSTLTEAVRLRLRSDVPLGAFLSGGIDSTIISGLMQQEAGQPIHTFSIGFPVKKFDETSYAREAAAFLGTRHHEQIVEPHALSILPKLIWHYDEPFADSSAIPTMYLSEMTRQRSHGRAFGRRRRRAVLRLRPLSGRSHRRADRSAAGLGEEVFVGLSLATVPQLGRTKIISSSREATAWPNCPSRRSGVTCGGSTSSTRAAAALSTPTNSPHGWARSTRPISCSTPIGCARVATSSRGRRVPTCSRILPCDILTKVDIASMAYGLEARCPFLDTEVAELAARMPIELKQTTAGGKRILIDTFRDLLPPSIQTRPKMGFGVPLDSWFRGELRPLLHDTLLDSRSLSRGFFKPESVRRLVEEHDGRRWDHSYRLWALLCFELWQRTWLDAALPPTAPVAEIVKRHAASA